MGIFLIASQCKANARSCNKVQISCNEFCGCAECGCKNKWNEQALGIEEKEDDDEDNESNKPFLTIYNMCWFDKKPVA